MNISKFVTITRINFIPASLMPFLIGVSLAVREGFEISPVKFLLGITAVASAHISGNVLNDYFDWKSKADVNENPLSPFFGGSKIIERGIAGEKQTLIIAVIFLLVSIICTLAITFVTQDIIFLAILIVVGFLTIQYTAPPFKFAYKMLGELDVFLLFGVFMVMGSFYLFTGVFTFNSFLAGLPIAFMISAVLVCNEVPDIETDRRAGKNNLVTLVGKENGFLLYGFLVLLSYLSVVMNYFFGVMSFLALPLIAVYIFSFKALMLLKAHSNFQDMINASKITILVHLFSGIGMIGAILFK